MFLGCFGLGPSKAVALNQLPVHLCGICLRLLLQRSYVSAVVQLSTGAGISVGNVLAEATGRNVCHSIADGTLAWLSLQHPAALLEPMAWRPCGCQAHVCIWHSFAAGARA